MLSWSILQYFWPALSDNWSWKLNIWSFLSGRLRQVLLYSKMFNTFLLILVMLDILCIILLLKFYLTKNHVFWNLVPSAPSIHLIIRVVLFIKTRAITLEILFIISSKVSQVIHLSCLLVLMFYIQVNNFSVTPGHFLGWTSTKQRIKCLAQGHTECTWWGSNQQPLNPKSSTLPLSHCALLISSFISLQGIPDLWWTDKRMNR